uniref:Uncharacterized protein n=1 Tax=Faecalibaculum rodentium TaxID=1702221 RepID=A0A140DXC7_9FIRM|nr:hypothetical protein AALO17_21700 [Faecalibaculum rodentium]
MKNQNGQSSELSALPGLQLLVCQSPDTGKGEAVCTGHRLITQICQ